MNDGFCDNCLIFQGHEDIHSANTRLGKFSICSDCREQIDNMNREEQKQFFLKLTNKDHDILLDAVENPPEPNEALKDLFKKK